MNLSVNTSHITVYNPAHNVCAASIFNVFDIDATLYLMDDTPRHDDPDNRKLLLADGIKSTVNTNKSVYIAVTTLI